MIKKRSKKKKVFKVLDNNSMIEILKRLYKSEINYRIQSFYDEGWVVALGDKLNGFKYEQPFCVVNETLEEAVNELGCFATVYYPKSKFAK